MRISPPKLPFGERPDVVMIAATAAGALIGYWQMGEAGLGIGMAAGAAYSALYNKANRILISLEIVHRRLAPEDFRE